MANVKACSEFVSDLGSWLGANSLEPAEGSPGRLEWETFANPNLVRHAQSCGVISIDAVTDHLWAFSRTETEPILRYAPLTCIRGALESAAIAAWLLDPGVDAQERVARHFRWRYEGFEQQRSLAESRRDDAIIEKVDAGIDRLIKQASELGINEAVDKNGKRIGIGSRMMGITELIGSVLQKKPAYRLLSAAAHGHQWMLSQVGLKVEHVQAGDDVRLLGIPQANPAVIAWAAIEGVQAVARAAWALRQLYCPKDEGLVPLLDRYFDQPYLSQVVCFWRAV